MRQHCCRQAVDCLNHLHLPLGSPQWHLSAASCCTHCWWDGSSLSSIQLHRLCLSVCPSLGFFGALVANLHVAPGVAVAGASAHRRLRVVLSHAVTCCSLSMAFTQLRGTVTHSRTLAPSKCQASVCNPICLYKTKTAVRQQIRETVAAAGCSHNRHTRTHPREAHTPHMQHELVRSRCTLPPTLDTHEPLTATPLHTAQHAAACSAAGKTGCSLGPPHTASQQVG